MKRLFIVAFLPVFAGVVCAQNAADKAELVPQVESGGSILVAPRDAEHPTLARYLALDAPDPNLGRYGATRYTTAGVLQWRDARNAAVLKVTRLASWAAFGNGSVQIIEVALSPSGTLVASKGQGDILRWQNAWSGEVVRQFRDIEGPFGFSPLGHKFVAVQKTSALAIFAVEGQGQTTLLVANAPKHIEWSPDETGLLVSSGLPQKALRLEAFDTLSGTRRFVIEVPAGEENIGFRWAPDGGVVSASVDGRGGFDTPSVFWVRRFDAQGRPTEQSSVQLLPVFPQAAIKFEHGDVVLRALVRQTEPGGSWSEVTRYFRFHAGQNPLPIEGKEWQNVSENEVNAVVEGTPRFFPGHSPIEKRAPQVATVVPLLFVGKRGADFLAADASHLWNVSREHAIRSFSLGAGEATALDISRGGTLFTSAGAGGYGSSSGAFAGVWNTRTGNLLWKRSVELDMSNGNDFSIGGRDWTTASRFSPDETLLANGSAMGNNDSPPLQVRDARSGHIRWTWAGSYSNASFQQSVVALDWLPGGHTLAVAQNWFDGTKGQMSAVRLVDGLTGRVQRLFALQDLASGRLSVLAFSPQGRTLAVASSRGDFQKEDDWPVFVAKQTFVELRDAHNGALRRRLRAPGLEQPGTSAPLEAIAWSPDGQHLAAASQNRQIFVWNTRSGALEARFDAHFQTPRALCWLGPNCLASTGDDGLLFVWNTRTLRLAATQLWLRPKAGSSIEWLAWTPDGFFDASHGALPFVRFRAGSRLLAPGALFKERFNPAKVRAALLGSQR